METELTKKIKQATHTYKPKMSSGKVGRTIRYADEVWTPNGIVDSIRFEDYIAECDEYCKRIDYETDFNAGDTLLSKLMPSSLGKCKIEGNYYPCKECKGCFFHVKNIKRVDMMITAYEVKITLSDFKSKNGHNIDSLEQPIGNENYYCVPKELVPLITDLVPEHVGILSYGENGLRCVKESQFLYVNDQRKIELLYNAMKKWCDGVMRKE